MLFALIGGIILGTVFLCALGLGAFAVVYDWSLHLVSNFWSAAVFAASMMLVFAWIMAVCLAAVVLLNHVGTVSLS